MSGIQSNRNDLECRLKAVPVHAHPNIVVKYHSIIPGADLDSLKG